MPKINPEKVMKVETEPKQQLEKADALSRDSKLVVEKFVPQVSYVDDLAKSSKLNVIGANYS